MSYYMPFLYFPSIIINLRTTLNFLVWVIAISTKPLFLLKFHLQLLMDSYNKNIETQGIPNRPYKLALLQLFRKVIHIYLYNLLSYIVTLTVNNWTLEKYCTSHQLKVLETS